MSSLTNDIIMEDLADEFYDDVSKAIHWLVANFDQDLDELTSMRTEDVCDMFVTESFYSMEDCYV